MKIHYRKLAMIKSILVLIFSLLAILLLKFFNSTQDVEIIILFIFVFGIVVINRIYNHNTSK